MAYDHPIAKILENDISSLVVEEEDRRLIQELVGVKR